MASAKLKSAKFKKMMERRKARAKKRGIALIMVLGAITIMTVFLTELQTDTSAAVAGALAERDRLKAEYYAKSAVNLSRMLLASEPLIRTDPAVALILGMISPRLKQIPVWEFTDLVLGAFNGGDHATAFGTNVGVDISTAKNIGLPGKGYFNVRIVDEDSKINLNGGASANPPTQLMLQLMTHFAQPQYATMFESRDADDQFSDPLTLCGSIIDWADGDENLTNCADPTKPASGAEDNIYQMLGLGYRRKNAAYDSLEEVRLVRGMDDDRWANFIDPDSNDPKKRLFTVWGQDITGSSININTADPLTLWAIVCAFAAPQTPICTDPAQQILFLEVFRMIRMFAPGVPLFASFADLRKTLKGEGMVGPFLASLGVQPVTFDPKYSTSQLRKLFKTESKMFSIYAEGILPGTKREARVRIHAVIDMREKIEWSKLAQNAQAAATGQPLPSQTTAGTPGAPLPDDDNAPVDQEFINAYKTNPFGQIVYYRVD